MTILEMTTRGDPVAEPQCPRALPPFASGDDDTLSLVNAGTLAAWLGCLVVGVVGLRLPYRFVTVAATELPPAVVEHMQMAMVDGPSMLDPSPSDALAAPAAAPAQASAPDPPSPADAATFSAAPALVAAPDPAIAFVQPIPLVQKNPPRAGPSRGSTAVRHLRFGYGQGAQPDPEYPDAARHSLQQGVVHVSFTIGTDGSVTSAELAPGCRWPLLNQAALRVVRERWRFAPGPVRYCDISIEFKLNEP